MLTTGNQLKAARVLAEIEQTALAALVGVNVNTIRNMESSGAGPIAGRAQTVQAVQRALESAGIEFLNHGQPGVRLAKPSDGTRATRDQIQANATEVRSQAASAADEAMSDMDATKQEKADRRGALTGEPAMVEKARDKGRSRK